MKVYTFFTDSHKNIFNIFEKYFPYEDNIELNIKWFPQECLSGKYMGDGWNSTMKRKVEYVIQALEETKDGEWFVHSDCDILFFKDWDKILKEKKDNFDIILQNDAVCLCAGFFFCKSNSNTKKLWNLIYSNLEKFDNDQTALNYFLRNLTDLKIAVLPDTYFTYGLLNAQPWSGENFIIPNIEKIKIFHANWTNGVDNKLLLLNKCLEQKYK